MTIKIYEDNKYKLVRSEHYNTNFDKETGFFQRWGKTEDDDPIMAPAPEILDIEISTRCSGIYDKPCKFCSPAGTKVLTPIGEKNIEDIKVGDTVISVILSSMGNAIKENTVEQIFQRNYSGDLIKITTEENQIFYLTPEHSLILADGTEKEAKDLEITDILISIDEFKTCKTCKKLKKKLPKLII